MSEELPQIARIVALEERLANVEKSFLEMHQNVKELLDIARTGKNLWALILGLAALVAALTTAWHFGAQDWRGK